MFRVWLAIFCLFSIYSSDLFAQQEDIKLVRVSNVVYYIEETGHPGRLDEIAFSIQNLSTRPLEWLSIHITVTNSRMEVIHQTEKEIDVVKYYGKPFPPKTIRQMTESLYVDGFRMDKKNGDVKVTVVNARFSQ